MLPWWSCKRKKKKTKALHEHQGETLNNAWRQAFRAVVLLVETKQEAINVNIYGLGKTWASMKPYMEEITKFCLALINVNYFVPRKQKQLLVLHT